MISSMQYGMSYGKISKTITLLQENALMNELMKYPRTPHLLNSPGATSDDKWVSPEGLNILRSSPLVVTEKMDGSNYTMTRNYSYGRSVDARANHWDSRVKQIWSSIHHDIPEGWRLSGENMYARKSVAYDDLPGVFLLFAVWNDENEMLSWDETVEWGELLGLPVPQVLYRGNSFDEAVTAWSKNFTEETSEGFVVRNSETFRGDDFKLNVAKYVRANHVRTSDDWRHRDDYQLNTFI